MQYLEIQTPLLDAESNDPARTEHSRVKLGEPDTDPRNGRNFVFDDLPLSI
jgi:hypothetical protein